MKKESGFAVLLLFIMMLFPSGAFSAALQSIPISPFETTASMGQMQQFQQPFGNEGQESPDLLEQEKPEQQPKQPMPSMEQVPPQYQKKYEQYLKSRKKTREVKPSEEVSKPEFPAVPRAAKEETSVFERYISGNLPDISTNLKQFGYDLFLAPPETFAPVENVPVGPDYVLGPGDGVRISLWGKFDWQGSVDVDSSGNISLPKIGTLGVAGLNFKELKDLLHKEFSKYFTGFEMNVSMGALRTIRFYVVGNAKSPGSYTISSLSTLVNALFAAGGPAKGGTMRDIQVKRNGNTVTHFDMYDLLLKGDKTKDVRLMPEDVIFIPPVGKLVGIAGNVNKPAIYELKGEETISQLIEMAGGLNELAFKDRVEIERITDKTRQVVFESDLEEARNMKITAGDLVKIFPIFSDERVVRITGAVQRADEYGFKPGMTIKDLISLSGGLTYYAYNKEAELTRVHLTNEGPKTEKIIINLEKAMTGDPESNIALQQDDYLFVRAIPEWRLYHKVMLDGEVAFPGIYTIKKGERLSSLLERAGGFTDKAYLKGALFTRPSVKELQRQQLKESIDRLDQQIMTYQIGASQTALNPADAAQQKVVQQQQNALIAKLRSIEPKGRLVVKFDLPENLKGTFYDIELEDGDMISIPKDPHSVNVMGNVYNPTAFIYNPNERVSGYIAQAGGITEDAAKSDIFILKADGSAISRRQSGGLFGWNSETKRIESGSFMSTKLDSGDTVIVPPQLEKSTWLKDVKDFTQVLYQIAVTAGVLLLAY